MTSPTKVCKACKKTKPNDAEHFRPYDETGRPRASCRECEAADRRERRSQRLAERGGAAPSSDGAPATEPAKVDSKETQREADRARREASDYEPLKPEDLQFDLAEGNDGRVDHNASRDKKQEYSKSDGDYLQLLRDSGGDPARMPAPQMAQSSYYLAIKSEQERRFQNRRLARTASISAANEALHIRLMMQVATEYFRDKAIPSGYARKHVRTGQPRTLVALLSDLHFGADLRKLDNPEPYGAEEESRCFGKVVAEVSDYKPHHRDDTRLLVLANGDNFDGMLGHDARAGGPLIEQKAACLSYFLKAITTWASVFPLVEVHWRPGNHGRDTMRHPGRATESSWDGHEWFVGYCLAQMCSGLPNVRFSVPFRTVTTVDLHGVNLLLSHGDTEPKIGDPDTKADQNYKELGKVNTSNVYGQQYGVAAFGHFHKARYFPWRGIEAVFNGSIVPANGHARSSGYIKEKRCQVIWEAVRGYPVGDLRYLVVDQNTDRDSALNHVIPPFRFAA